jgi:hypothetical protein
MRSLVSALALFTTAIAYTIGLACSPVIKDPYLTWDFGGPSIAGGVLTVVFYLMFRHIDKEEFVLDRDDENDLDLQETNNIATESVLKKTSSLPQIAAEHEEFTVGSK